MPRVNSTLTVRTGTACTGPEPMMRSNVRRSASLNHGERSISNFPYRVQSHILRCCAASSGRFQQFTLVSKRRPGLMCSHCGRVPVKSSLMKTLLMNVFRPTRVHPAVPSGSRSGAVKTARVSW